MAKDELESAFEAADEYELLWHRARAGAKAATKGIERLQARCQSLEDVIGDLRLEVASERARGDRAEREVLGLRKKVERLSLKIIGLWGAE